MKSRRTRALAGALLALAAAAPSRLPAQPSVIVVSVEALGGSSRVRLQATAAIPYSFEKRAGALRIRLTTPSAFRVRQAAFAAGFVRSVGWSQDGGGYTFTLDLASESYAFKPSIREDPFELVLDIGPGPAEAPKPAAPPEPQAASGSATGPETGMRPLGEGQASRIKTIVIDPGHGGIETGAKGKFGALEKDVTLAIGLKLRAIIERNMAFRVFMTRDKDVDVSLENRAALANNHKADLFVSIHANGSPRKNSHGSETYFLSSNATDEESRRLAYLENASGALDGRIEPDDRDDIKLILWDLAQAAYLKQSSQLAERIQAGLNALLGTANRGVKQAPFKVLTGAACPAVLVETAFISNPEEEKALGTEAFQDSIAQAIYLSLVEYLKLYP